MTPSLEEDDPGLVAPLLKTKLEAPDRPRLVIREELLEELSAGSSEALTLIYGPAGCGKTMLAAQWRADARQRMPVAWLSLDAEDNDPVRFWVYLVEALRTVLPGFGEEALAMLRAPGRSTVEAALPGVVNELAALPGPAAFVLDDYHLIEEARVHAAMASLLEHAPATLRVVVTSRVEPPLGVGTLRARGRLAEIDAGRLRFSRSEAQDLLNDVHGLDLPDEVVDRLHQRTEGWAAGLYLAVLSLRGREDVEAFVESFAGSDRRIVDYLGAEVLAELPEEEVAFLLQTSVLDRFCAPLCDAVTDAKGSRAMLDRIERANYFLIPLDPSHDWYRYHHLFGELLRHELERRGGVPATELHRRAGRWFLEAGLVSDAIAHLTAAGEHGEVADLIATHWLPFTNAGERATVARWLEALPREQIESDGRLCLSGARTAAVVGAAEEVLPWLELAERAPRHSPRDDPWLAEQATVFRATAWQQLGDMGRSREIAASLGPLDGSSFWHALAASNLGAVAYRCGEPREAARLLELALDLNRDQIAMVSAFALGQLAVIAADEGDWRICAARLEAAFELIRTHRLEEYPQGSLAHVARGRMLSHERRPAEARAELERAAALARRGVGRVDLAYVLTTLARFLGDLGERAAARELVFEAREALASAPDPGTLVPRLLEREEKRLRLVVHGAGADAVVTDELTAREQAVLRLLPSGLSTREIGQELGVSRDTVKSHTKSIYRKLGSSSRPDAVSRARELGLL